EVSPIPKAVPLQRLSKVGLTLCVEALYACVLNTGTTLFVQNQSIRDSFLRGTLASGFAFNAHKQPISPLFI
ncbi:hypothetical protein, partial [Vacuolonema iberomarrocanum]|uniref:hypothetical protein n=1 Tax=Vacuolonema iberomarrocanum TaxID=3454632 RepID=UPI003F6DD4A2